VTSRFAVLSAVRDGDGYVLGSTRTRGFVAVPEIGGLVVGWLQEGDSVDECTRRASEHMGEPVDVAAFVQGLTDAGLLAGESEEPPAPTEPSMPTAPSASPGPAPAWSPPGSPVVPAGRRRAGRILFGPVGLAVQIALVVTAAVTMTVTPGTRPRGSDVLATPVPLLSLLVLIVLGSLLGLVHELAHVLAAWAAGVTSRISIGRRMIAMVYQTDLTRLWSVPRRQRVVPLAAGLLVDGALVGAIVLVEATIRMPAEVSRLLRAIVFLNATAIAYQFLIFLRTDVYALFLLASGCRNLWGTKGALARRAVRRDTEDDRALLSTVGAREIRWARAYLCLYVPGALFTGWYFVVFAVPAFGRLLISAWDAVRDHGLLSVSGGAGALAFALTAASTGYVLYGVARTALRLTRRHPPTPTPS